MSPGSQLGFMVRSHVELGQPHRDLGCLSAELAGGRDAIEKTRFHGGYRIEGLQAVPLKG